MTYNATVTAVVLC